MSKNILEKIIDETINKSYKKKDKLSILKDLSLGYISEHSAKTDYKLSEIEIKSILQKIDFFCS